MSMPRYTDAAAAFLIKYVHPEMQDQALSELVELSGVFADEVLARDRAMQMHRIRKDLDESKKHAIGCDCHVCSLMAWLTKDMSRPK